MDIFKLFRSFRHALRGLWYTIRNEQNFRIELAAAFVVILTMIVLRVDRWEAIALIFAIFSVLILEVVNTLLERLVNIFKPRIHPYARIIKDTMAAAVFLTSLGAAIVGILVFWPYIF